MIDLEGINKTYILGEHPLHALQDVNLKIEAGDYLSLMGPSGSGKSTLLNMIGLLDRPDCGRYWLNGKATEMLSEVERAVLRRQYIGFVFQSFHLIPRLNAIENVEIPLMLAGVSKAERRPKVIQLLSELGLEKHLTHLPKQLSGGQLQRVGIARALITNPQVLLADEPTGNLDQKSGHEVTEILEKYNKSGITLLIVTHDPNLGKRAKIRLNMVDGKLIDINHNEQKSDDARQTKGFRHKTEQQNNTNPKKVNNQ